MVNAVVFDMDGTLINSREKIMKGIDATLRSKGVIRTHDQMTAVMGKPIPVMYELLAPGHDLQELVALNFKNQEALEHTVARFDHAVELLQKLRGQGIKIGLFTGFDDGTYAALREYELLDYFDSVFECTRYTKHKPDPEGLLLCMQELGVLPKETVYIGDSITDITAGLAAEVYKTVGISHGFTSRERLLEVGAEHIVDDLVEFEAYLASLKTAGERA